MNRYSHTWRHALVIALAATPAVAQSTVSDALIDSIRINIESATETGDILALETTIAVAERALAASSANPGTGAARAEALLHHYHAYGLYRAGTLVLGRDGSGKSRPYFDRARDELEALAQGQAIPETYALLSAVYGMQIAAARVQMIVGIQLGPKSTSMSNRALDVAPNNPRVWVVRGIGAFNTPGAFGGGMDKAEEYLKKAIALFSSDAPPSPLPAWGLADAHIWLGRVYAARNQRDSARAEFQSALLLQPKNAWVTKTLLPLLDAR